MIFTLADQIAHLSRGMTLYPGDVILTGTPAGVGTGRGEFLNAGDVVRIEIERIGTLTNTNRLAVFFDIDGNFALGFESCRQALIGGGKAKQRSPAFGMFDIRCRGANFLRMCAIAFRALRTASRPTLGAPVSPTGSPPAPLKAGTSSNHF